ncbi:hypothetical protein CGZ80_18545 [Rhodopirellula sp. MGV]|nr:hypothetical protein CGZ80_18545 [Rhodopirellula sp. MGV]PNY37957.1 hypothetical protein C2E31_05515 [Rhodopirellula baltica]
MKLAGIRLPCGISQRQHSRNRGNLVVGDTKHRLASSQAKRSSNPGTDGTFVSSYAAAFG